MSNSFGKRRINSGQMQRKYFKQNHRRKYPQYIKKEISIKVQETYRTSNRQKQKRNSLQHIITKSLNIQNKEKVEGEKYWVTYKSRSIIIITDFSMETLKARRTYTDIWKCWEMLIQTTIANKTISHNRQRKKNIIKPKLSNFFLLKQWLGGGPNHNNKITRIPAH